MKTIKCPPYGKIMENSRYGQKGELSGCSCHSYCYFELLWHMSWWTLPRGAVYMCLLHCLTSCSFLSPLQSGFFPCHFTSDLNFVKSNGRLSVPILFLSLSLCFTTFSSLLSLCAPPACPAAPFWLLFGFLFFQCPLNDGISWRSINIMAHSLTQFSHKEVHANTIKKTQNNNNKNTLQITWISTSTGID